MGGGVQTTSAKKGTPSMGAAAVIMEGRMSPPAGGRRGGPSLPAAASLPMPIPAPRTARPAPKPAARNAIATLPIRVFLPFLMRGSACRGDPVHSHRVLPPAGDLSPSGPFSNLVRRAVVVVVLA